MSTEVVKEWREHDAPVTYQQFTLPLQACGFCSGAATSHLVAEGYEKTAGILHCKQHKEKARAWLLKLLKGEVE